MLNILSHVAMRWYSLIALAEISIALAGTLYEAGSYTISKSVIH